METLKYYKIHEGVKEKLVYGESISQTNQFIISKAAQIGFTAKSVVVSPEMKGVGHWKEVDSNVYSPIAQGVVLLKNKGNRLAEAQKFYDFLFSNKGKEILDKFGYSAGH